LTQRRVSVSTSYRGARQRRDRRGGPCAGPV